MQTLMIPQSPIVNQQGIITQEWLVFMNELIRLSNQVISSDVIDKADGNEEMVIEGFKQSSIIAPSDDEVSTYVAPTIIHEEPIENVSLNIVQDEPINNVALVINSDELPQDNPYALMAAIKQQQYDQEIWSLNV